MFTLYIVKCKRYNINLLLIHFNQKKIYKNEKYLKILTKTRLCFSMRFYKLCD